MRHISACTENTLILGSRYIADICRLTFGAIARISGWLRSGNNNNSNNAYNLNADGSNNNNNNVTNTYAVRPVLHSLTTKD